ncbi:glycosyltransferase family 2 protein [Chryseobacterium luquanense]|uniref:Glycosyltransferase n=1 Tax=Chryseobacterium luquanense TaxID=2983766 RepID=A0ABT3Y6D2_9FLAO|nr:glycosyltransferase family 2 protein [Chryseobacterium luquanense]MCX8533710.1 glycosyltransferase [Chryseobacterium luquanense]
MSYKLSIITINYNNAKGLEKTFESVIGQNSKDFEYIVVDGSSTDESRRIIERNENNINAWISEPDSGVYNAMNKGIEMASGDYLLFLNSGDKLANPDVITKILPLLSNTDIIYGNLIYSLNEVPQTLFSPSKNIDLTYFLHSFLPHPSSFIKKTLFQEIGFYNEKFKIISDWEFFLRAIIVNKASYIHIDEVISDFDNSGISSNSENERIIYKEKQAVYEELFPNLQNEIKLIEFASSRRMLQIKNIQNNHSFLWKLLKVFLNILNSFTGKKEAKAFQKL